MIAAGDLSKDTSDGTAATRGTPADDNDSIDT